MGHNHADHDHSHAYGHDHGAGHSHAPADFGRAFAIGVVLNAGFVAVEAAYGLIANSTALLADAGHNLSDVLGLLIAWGTTHLAKRAPSKRFTYGFKGSTILAAMFNAVLLLVAIGAITLEAVQRFGEPVHPDGRTVIVVALIGIAINGVTAWMFARGRKDDLNIRGAYLHMAADAAVSAGVVVSGLLTVTTGLAWIDPVTSLIIVAVIFWGTWGLLRHSLDMSLGGVPAGIDLADVEAELAAAPGVSLVHDLHVWHMSTTEVALTAHLVVPGGHNGDAFLAAIRERIGSRFGIHHSTIQVETAGGTDCEGCD